MATSHSSILPRFVFQKIVSRAIRQSVGCPVYTTGRAHADQNHRLPVIAHTVRRLRSPQQDGAAKQFWPPRLWPMLQMICSPIHKRKAHCARDSHEADEGIQCSFDGPEDIRQKDTVHASLDGAWGIRNRNGHIQGLSAGPHGSQIVVNTSFPRVIDLSFNESNLPTNISPYSLVHTMKSITFSTHTKVGFLIQSNIR
jgi:hypothetical protein